MYQDRPSNQNQPFNQKRPLTPKDVSISEAKLSKEERTLNRTEITTNALWVEVVGTILSAIGNTPISFLTQEDFNNLNLIGDTLQLGGTTIQVEDEKYLTLNKIGNIIQAGGLIEEVAGYAFPQWLTNLRTTLQNQGNQVQAVGLLLSFVFTKVEPTLSSFYETQGTIVSAAGLGMQILSAAFPSDNERGQTLNTIGNWVQVIGAILTAIGQEFTLEKQIHAVRKQLEDFQSNRPDVVYYSAMNERYKDKTKSAISNE